jgi:hypothetical protein
MLVAAADVVLILASAGALVLIALASVAVIAVASVGTWHYLRRQAVDSDVATPAPVRVPVRRP